MPAIEATDIYKVFGRRAKEGVARLKAGESREDLMKDGLNAAVIDASFTVEEGEMFVVMGLSGSGKSTLIRAVNGLLEPTSGTVKVYGDNITDASAKKLREIRRERVSMVFQHFALFPHRSVRENAAYGLETRGVSKAERLEKATEALELTGLKGWEDSLPGQLSGGMQQRVGLARALAAETDILLMDEAFSALDPLIRRDMQDQLIELQHRLHKTILFISHDLNEAMRLGDRIAMMRDGRIVQIGTAEEILTDPANDYVAKFTHDVDRSRVLTAAAVMEPPVVVLGSEQGPRSAHRLMREHQMTSLFVVDRDKRLQGVLRGPQVSKAVDEGMQSITPILDTATPRVTQETTIADLLTGAASTEVPLAVVDDQERLMGVIPRVTLLNALSHSEDKGTGPAEPGLADSPQVGLDKAAADSQEAIQ